MATGCTLNPAPTSSRRGDLMVLDTAKLERAFRGPQRAEEMSQKNITKEFTIVSNEIQHVMKSEEIKNQKVYVSPRPPPTISYKGNWTCNLDSDVARSSEDIQTNRTKTQCPIIKYSEICYKMERKKPWNVPSLIATLLIKRHMIRSQIHRVRGNPYPLRFDTQTC